MATTSMQAHATLARNLLSSVLALAFPDHLATDATAQSELLQQLPQLHAILAQHNVFAFVTDGKALDKLLSRLLQLIDTPQGVDKALKAAAFELLTVVVSQAPLPALETLVLKLTERILKIAKYVKDAPRVVAAACELARSLVRPIELFSPETRRELHDWLTKLLPVALSLLGDLAAKSGSESLHVDEIALFHSVLGVFTELLEVSPSAVRSASSKLEGLVASIALYSRSIAASAPATDASAKCLALLANASDKPHPAWKQAVDRALELAHQLVDPIAGKRVVTPALPTGMKAWLRGAEAGHAAVDLSTLAVYERAEALLDRLQLVVRVLEESLASRAVSEREVQLVVADTVALARRIVTVRAYEVGKQSAISEDGVRLPVSVVYGVLPRFHALGLRCLSAVVTRAGLCALRHGSKIARTLVLASENVHADAHVALFNAVETCVRVLGASTLEKLGQPLLEHLVGQCKYDLEDAGKPKTVEADDAKLAADAKSKNSKGKKRKRQVGDLSQLSLDAATNGTLTFLSARDQRVLVGNVDAALAAIATCVAVYGGLLKSETRSQVSDVALLAMQVQAKRRMLPAAPPASEFDRLALMLLTDLATSDANGAHATNLVKSLGFWSSPHCPSSLVQLVALNVGEALMHPRGPPLSINFDKAIQAHATPAASSTGLSGFLGLTSQRKQEASVKTAVAVRGQLDWEREESKPVNEEETETKRVKTGAGDAEMEESSVADVASAEEVEEPEEEADDEEEDYDDERPGSVAEEAVPDEDEPMETAPVIVKDAPVTAAADDDDDEFPDIVDGDDDDDDE